MAYQHPYRRSARGLSPERIAEAKRISVLPLCAALGLTVHKEGRSFKCLCPCHEDRTPSMSLKNYPNGAGWTCFGCQKKGDAIALVKAVRGVGFAKAVEALEEIQGVSHAIEFEPTSPIRKAVQGALDPTSYDVIARRELELSPLSGEVWAYLQRRGIAEEARRAGCGGREHPMLQGALCETLVREFGKEPLVRAGVLNGWGSLKNQDHRLAIPWKTREGRIACVQRRHLADWKPRYLFPSGYTIREPFGADLFDAEIARVEATGREPEIVLTEGALDCLAARALARLDDLPWVVLGAASAEGTERIAWDGFVRGRLVRLAFDNDEPGDRAARHLAGILSQAAREILRRRPCAAKDVGESLIARLS